MKPLEKEPFSWKSRGKSFYYAFSGLKTAFRKEHNMWIHISAAVIVLILGWMFSVTQTQWLCLWLCIGLVLSLEIINTAMEKLCDLVQPGFHPLIKQVKDLAAAAVLVAAFISVIVGAIIFLPPIIQLCSTP